MQVHSGPVGAHRNVMHSSNAVGAQPCIAIPPGGPHGPARESQGRQSPTARLGPSAG
jgi:hypothetical protein